MADPEYSGAGHDEIRRQQGRRVRFTPQLVNLNAYYGVGDQIIVVTNEAGAVFVHRRTGTLYFYHEEVEGFVNAFGEAYTGFRGCGNFACDSPSNSASVSCRVLDLPGSCTRARMVPHSSNGTGGSPGASYARVGVPSSARTLSYIVSD